LRATTYYEPKQCHYQTNAEKKVKNGDLNGHAVPNPDGTELGIYTIYCTFILFMWLNVSFINIS